MAETPSLILHLSVICMVILSWQCDSDAAALTGRRMDKEHKPVKGGELNTEFTCITPRFWRDTDAHHGCLHSRPPASPHSPLTLLPNSHWYRVKNNLLRGLLTLGLCSSQGLSALLSTIIAISEVTFIISMHSADKISSMLCNGKVHACTKCRDECVLLSVQQ